MMKKANDKGLKYLIDDSKQWWTGGPAQRPAPSGLRQTIDRMNCMKAPCIATCQAYANFNSFLQKDLTVRASDRRCFPLSPGNFSRLPSAPALTSKARPSLDPRLPPAFAIPPEPLPRTAGAQSRFVAIDLKLQKIDKQLFKGISFINSIETLYKILVPVQLMTSILGKLPIPVIGHIFMGLDKVFKVIKTILSPIKKSAVKFKKYFLEKVIAPPPRPCTHRYFPRRDEPRDSRTPPNCRAHIRCTVRGVIHVPPC